MDYPYILTQKALTIYADGRSRVAHADNKHFNEIKDALKQKDFDKVFSLMDKTEAVKAFGDGKVEVLNGVIYYNNQPLHNVLCDKIINMMDDGFDVSSMINFLENLMDNPSHNAVNELYLFLEHGNLPITPDGHFLAYKKVNNDFKDYHTGLFDNSPGKILEVLRNQVDDNRDNTCSSGLHFCSLNYLKHYYGGEGKVIILKINPRDVVSIPSDYNNTKGRSCRYEVVSEYTGPETQDAFHSSVIDPNDDNWNMGDPYGNDGDSWGEDSYAEEGFDSNQDLQTDRKALHISELDEETVKAISETRMSSEYDHLNDLLDGGSFDDNKPQTLTVDGSDMKPEHPDADNDGIPKMVKALVGQTRTRDNYTYLITSVAGPIRNPKGHFTGKWALYIKNQMTSIEAVFDMESILKDQLVQTFSRDIPENMVPAASLTNDILTLADQYKKNMSTKKDE